MRITPDELKNYILRKSEELVKIFSLRFWRIIPVEFENFLFGNQESFHIKIWKFTPRDFEEFILIYFENFVWRISRILLGEFGEFLRWTRRTLHTDFESFSSFQWIPPRDCNEISNLDWNLIWSWELLPSAELREFVLLIWEVLLVE